MPQAPLRSTASVLEKAQKELVCYQDKGMSVMEMSHRSAMYLDIYNETEALLRQLMGIPENYKVLFLQGGATLQFSAVPLNLMGEKNTADYADTGNFAHLAAEEAKKYGEVRIAASSREDGYTFIPRQFDWNPDAAYAYITTNNTIYGTRYTFVPDTGGGSAGGGYEQQYSLRADRRKQVRRDLCRCAEEHRPGRAVRGHHPGRPAGAGKALYAQIAELGAGSQERQYAQHAQHLWHLHGEAGV